jgi:hypothetical protein
MGPTVARGIGLIGFAIAATTVVACPSPETNSPPSCKAAFIGTKGAAPQIQLVYADSNGDSQPVMEGGAVPMLLPLQGGRVIYAGARVLNMDPCAAFLSASIRDPSNNEVRLDARTINFTLASDGWGEVAAGDLSSFGNIPACPNEWSAASLYEGTYLLDVSVKDREDVTVEAKMHVQPGCAEPSEAAECRCICKAGYKLGESCPPLGAGGGLATSSSGSGS